MPSVKCRSFCLGLSVLKHYVETINDFATQWPHVESGVCQDDWLSRALFSLLVNDLAKGMANFVARIIIGRDTLSFLVYANTLHWRHNKGVSNCLLIRFFRAKEISKPRVAGLCEGNSPGTGEFPAQKWPVTRKMFSFDDVIIDIVLIAPSEEENSGKVC